MPILETPSLTEIPIADARSGMMSVESVLALYLSAKEKKGIDIPLAKDFSSEEMSEYNF